MKVYLYTFPEHWTRDFVSVQPESKVSQQMYTDDEARHINGE